ncbi:hypothetical protein ACFZB9_01245 [Kitasatospora sp. NPDC008050]
MREEIQPVAVTSDPREAVRQMRPYLIGALLKLDERETTARVLTAARRAG